MHQKTLLAQRLSPRSRQHPRPRNQKAIRSLGIRKRKRIGDTTGTQMTNTGEGAQIGTAIVVATNRTASIPRVPARSTPHRTPPARSIRVVAPRTIRAPQVHLAGVIGSRRHPSAREPLLHHATNLPHTKNTSPVHHPRDRNEIKARRRIRKGKRTAKVAATTAVAVPRRRQGEKITTEAAIVIVTNRTLLAVQRTRLSTMIIARAKKSISSVVVPTQTTRGSLQVLVVRPRTPSRRIQQLQ